MSLLKKSIFHMVFLIILLTAIPFTLAADAKPEKQNVEDCSYYITQITQNNQTINSLNRELDYYKNLSSYYIDIYENKDANLTNKELIEIHQNLTIINNNISNLIQKMGDIENNFNTFSIELGITLFGVGFLTILEIIFYLKRKKHHE